MKQMTGLALAAAMLSISSGVQAQAGKPAPAVTAANSAAAVAVSSDTLTKTVHEVWVDSGRNEEKFYDTVKGMAEMSANKRGVSLPDTEAAGQKMGTLIKTSARQDPDQLLYAVVDAAVRQTAGPSPHVPKSR